MRSVFALLALLLLAVAGQSVADTECSSCAQDYCTNVNADQPDQCYVVESSQISCNCNTSAIRCVGSSSTVINVEGCDVEGFNASLPGMSSTNPIGNGFYLIRGRQFCKSGCLDKIYFHTENSNQNTSNTLRLHIYKRYPLTPAFIDAFFVEQYSFNVTLTPVELEASDYNVEAIVTDSSACFDSEDYLGLSLGQGLQISTTSIVSSTPLDGLQQYEEPPVSSCSSDSTILQLPRLTGLNSIPVMAFTYRERAITTTNSDSTEPHTTVSSLNTGTVMVSTKTSGDPISETRTSTVVTPQLPTSSSTSLIVGVLIAIVLVVATLVTITILVLLYFKYIVNSHKGYLKKDPRIQVLGGGGSIVSMNSESVNYHGSNMIHYTPTKETIENIHAENEEVLNHHYHVPFEMNMSDGANARSTPWQPNAYHNSQVQPAGMVDMSEAVINSNYGVPLELFGTSNPPSSPTYQDPNELAGTPQMLNRRDTIPNTLYSTTAEFGVKTVFASSSQPDSTELPSPIYNEPFELKDPPSVLQHPQIDSPIVRPRMVPAVRIGPYSDIDGDSQLSGSRNSLDQVPGNLALEYSLPVPVEKPPSTVSPLAISHGGSQSSQHMLGVITGDSSNHHYHLLDDKASQSGYTTDEDDDDFTASKVHHVVDQPGAYVPNSEERRELYNGDTLKPASIEVWKKSSFKRGKFFVRHEKFWVPSQNKATLFDQLSQKKFREIFKDHLDIKSHIGSGMFGSVQRAKMNYPSGSVDVAVKIMKPSILEDAQVKFLQEAAIMGQFFHPNIIELFGIVTLNKPLMIVMEYMPLGDLHTYLHKQYRSAGAAPPQAVTLLKFCRQVVHGMTYLAGKHFVHRDLAARNVFVSSSLVCKIGDFGMSRNLMDEEYYKSQGGVVPIKWTAPEGLLFKKYSSASDVYSYGMTMFEIWSLGEKPLRDIPIQNVAKTMADGYCQPPAPGTPREIYKVMIKCWNPQHYNRVNFEEISEILAGDDDSLLSWKESGLEENSTARVIGSPLENGYSVYKDLQNTYNSASSEITK